MKRLLAAVSVLAALTGCVVEVEDPRTSRTPTEQRPDGGGGQDQNGYRFVHTLDGGEPVRWSTCRPIRYVVRPANEPDGARRLLRESVDRISEVTGLEFSFEGETGEAPDDKRPLYQPNRYGDRWAPVLITYSRPEEYPRLEGGAVGYGGGAYVQQGGATPRYVSGMVVFDAEQMESMGEDAVRAVMMHELAHVVGLGHVEDRGQLMNPVQYGRQVTTLQDGDRAGLEALGAGECYEPLEPRSVRS